MRSLDGVVWDWVRSLAGMGLGEITGWYGTG